MKHKYLMLSALLLVLIGATTAYAADAYHNSGDKAPPTGNWWWGHRTNNRVVWEIHDYWSTTNAQNLRNAGNYRFEVEGYDPGQGASCDYLNVASVETYELPVTGYSILNGCGSSTQKELIHLSLLESSIQGNLWYRHWQYYYKANTPQAGAHVNYSFAPEWGSDSWLGKLNYNSSWNATSTDRAGLLNLY